MIFSSGEISYYTIDNTEIDVIESERLRLRNFKPSDLDDFLKYRTDPDTVRYQDWEVLNEEEGLKFIMDQQNASLDNVGDWVQLAIEHKGEGRMIGDCALRRYDLDGAIVEIGYAITPAYQRQGFAFEALQALISHLFDHYNIHKITARVDPRNTGSLGLLERLNFMQEGHIRQCFFDEIDQQWVDEMMFGLLKADFRNS